MATSYRPYLILFGLACLVRLLAAWPQQQPNYMDAAYSYVNAVNLAAGRGFVEDFVWNYLDQPGPPPRPSHLYWMPLTSILAWLGLVMGGATYRAAQVPFIILSALLAPLSFWAAQIITGRRWHSWLAGLFAIFSGFYFPFWTAIDNFTPFAVAGALALLLAYEGMAGIEEREARSGPRTRTDGPPAANPDLYRWPYIFAAGAGVGLAHLARADGPLLLAVIWFVYMARLRPPVSRFIFQAVRFSLVLLLGYLLVMGPWFSRNWLAVGTLLPVAGSQTIWLPTGADLFSSYNHLFSYGRTWTAQSFWAQGPGPVLQGRWWVLVANFQHVLAEWGMIFLGPLAVIGAWRWRRCLLIQLAGLYALLLFGAMTLVFAFPGALGGLFHSGAALLPFIYASALVGLDRLVAWAAARRRRWDVSLAQNFFGLGLLLLAIILSSFLYYNKVLKNNAWNSADQLYPAIAAWVVGQNPAAVVMINNPPAYRYHGGGLSVVIPDEDITTTLQAAHDYGVAYLILEPNHPAPLNQLYSPAFSQAGLSLVKTFGQGSGAVYIFEVVQDGRP